jgi:hypothetical protein
LFGRSGKKSFLPPPEESQNAVPRRPFTPVYPPAQASFVAVSEPADDLAKLAGKVAKLMADGRYRDVGVVAREVGGVARLATAVRELVRRGRAFDRSGQHFRMRRRDDGEPETMVVALLDGVQATPEPKRPTEEESAPDFDPSSDAGEAGDPSEAVEAPVQDGDGDLGLVLSEPPGDLVVPYDYVPGMSNTIFARRGSGKTYLAGVMVEELVGMPGGPEVVVVDPLGGWWGLGADAQGRPTDKPVLVLGGKHGHAPLRPDDGARVARLVTRIRPCPVVLDLSAMPPVEQYVFNADFGDAMWAGESFPVHIFYDEADEFCPQRFGALSTEQRRSRDAVERFVMRGRTAGYGVTLVTLRPAVLSMNARSQAGCMWLLCLAAPQDVAAVAGWMESASQGLSEERLSTCLGQLPVLPRGTAYMVRGGDEPALRKFKIRKKRTFDSSRTEAATMSFDVELASPGERVLDLVHEVLGI